MVGPSDGLNGGQAQRAAMRRSEVVALLNDLERKHDVNGMVHDGVQVWPLLRMAIGTHLIAHELKAAQPNDRLGTGAAKWGHAARGLVQLLTGLGKPGPTDLLFHTQNRFGEVWDGTFHDRYNDQVILAAQELGLRSAVVEHRTGVPVRVPRAVQCERFDASPTLGIATVLHSYRTKPDPRLINGLPALMDDVARVASVPSWPYLASQLHDFAIYRSFHRRILRATRPQAVLLVCWYAVENMAVLHECSRMGIRTVDLQHGVQGNAHLAYGPWASLPSAGYSLMPDAFWCWDDSSAASIRAWAGAGRIGAWAMGDPWLERGLSKPSAPLWQNDGRKKVLYAAFMPDPLPSMLIVAMKKTMATCQWVVRTHPATPELPSVIHELLKAEGLEGSVRISPASDMPMGNALLGCDLHITPYSSTVLEAASLGVPSLAIHRNAIDLFPEALASGSLRMALSVDDLVAHCTEPVTHRTTRKTWPPLKDRLATILQIRA